MKYPPRDAFYFFALALAITWVCDVPWVLACVRHAQPSPLALNLSGLGALGPTLAALILGARRRQLRDTFGRWRTAPPWIVLALVVPIAVHVLAAAATAALGAPLSHWFYPPVEPERIAALVMFPIGEEFGWRGFAYPRLAQRFGPIVGSVILGSVWALWHLGMIFTPTSVPTVSGMAVWMIELSAASVVCAWLFERGGRSMAVAIAFHAAAHIDNVNRAPETEVMFRALCVGLMVVAAVPAAWALKKHPPTIL